MANLTGGAANDTIIGANAISDTLNGAAGNDLIFGYGSLAGGFIPPEAVPGNDAGGGGAADNDSLVGGLGDDTIYAGGGNDRLDGGLGADSMDGGDQDDVYIVDDLGDTAAEIFADALGGTDFVLSSVTHALGTGIEHLTLTGAAASKGTGNALGNFIFGNAAGNELVGLAGNDTLDGGAGADSMEGGADNDIYVIDNAGDKVTEAASADIDTIRWNLAANLALASFANIENATLLGMAAVNLTGTAGDNVLEGNAGANKIDGGGGADTMAGGAGNDIYTVDGGDLVFELAGGGTDLVISGADFELGANIENLTLTGSAVTGAGNAGKNVITGNDKDNELWGDDPVQDGASDTLIGGKGDDRYHVGTGDVVVETLADSLVGGIDTVRWFGSGAYTLGANLENLELVGSGTGIGNALANKITGDTGNDTLDGKAGADTMDGKDGDDTYIVDNAGDKADDSGTGIDQALSSVTHTMGAGIENLTLTGAAAINGTGNGLDNLIVGNSGANTLNGDFGNDTLLGGAGDDKLTASFLDNPNSLSNRLDGGAGADTMIGNTHNDVFVVDNLGDQVVASATNFSGGVESSVTFTLGDEIARMTLTGAAAINGTGGLLDNLLTGNGAANKLVGLANQDTLDGGGGNDTLDGITGDGAADSLRGGAGNDLYLVGAGDIAEELLAGAAGGIDTVVSSAFRFDLGANIENLTLTGSAVQGIGNALKNVITGNDGANDLYGDPSAASDGASDTLIGGKGNDTYQIGTGDVVIETLADSLVGGVDEVTWYGGGAYTLAANVENLVLIQGTNGTGNALANKITGSGLDNILDGKAGADTMDGGGGDDTLIVDNLLDKTSDTAFGIDTVLSSVTHTIGDGIDNLTLTGAAAINGNGNTLGNVITGNSGANILDGKDGNDSLAGGGGNDSLVGGLDNDTLAGGAGNDSLDGGLGSDTYVFGPAPGKDRISNFEFGGGGDVLDLGDLLVGFIGGVSNAHDFVRLAFVGGLTTLQVDANGLAGGGSFTDVVTLANNPNVTLDQLLADGNLVLT